MIHNLIRRAPERVVAAAMMQPSGFRPKVPDLFHQNNIKGWWAAAVHEKPRRHDGHGQVSRDFVRSIRTPLLIAPDDVPAHPYKVAGRWPVSPRRPS